MTASIGIRPLEQPANRPQRELTLHYAELDTTHSSN